MYHKIERTLVFLHVRGEGFLFNANSTLLQLYHGESTLHSKETMMILALH